MSDTEMSLSDIYLAAVTPYGFEARDDGHVILAGLQAVVVDVLASVMDLPKRGNTYQVHAADVIDIARKYGIEC